MVTYKERHFFSPETSRLLVDKGVVSTSKIYWKQDGGSWFLGNMKWKQDEVPAYWLADFISDDPSAVKNCQILWGAHYIEKLYQIVVCDNKESFIIQSIQNRSRSELTSIP
jgi:hypothetical protein